MSQSPLEHVAAHWHKLSLDFHSSVEQALKRREIPGLKSSRVYRNEGGILSAQREYLRVSAGRHTFEMCAAPLTHQGP